MGSVGTGVGRDSAESRTMIFLSPMTLGARFQDLPLHILALHLNLLINTHPYYPSTFSGDFRAISTSHDSLFSNILCSLSNDCSSN